MATDRNHLNASALVLPTSGLELPKKSTIAASMHAEIKKKNQKEKKVQDLIKENIDVRRLKATELNKKVTEVKNTYKRYASVVELNSKKRYNQDI